MEFVYLGIVIFLFALSIFDLSVGVSNDAVNFLSSAIGSKAARFKLILAVDKPLISCKIKKEQLMTATLLDVS